jgi:CPA2 family monovalent cation:H+ antiporter-2
VRLTSAHLAALATDFLTEFLLLLAVATAGVAVFERLKLPAIAGFLVMGALVGPGGAGLIADPDRVLALAELGVVFLLFEIGLELPIERVRRMWRQSLVAGGLQVVLTLAVVSGVAIALGLDTPRALVIGALVAMSSTALVMRVLSGRDEIDAPQGQLAVGVLMFQDLCVVPFLLLIPVLAAGPEASTAGVAFELVSAVVALGVFFAVSRFVLPALLDRVARMQSRELFTMVALLVVMGSAVIAEEVGLTLSVGAFVGGLVLSATPYAHQLFAEVVGLRGLLIGVFFTAVGMLFDWRVALDQWPAILGYTAGVVVLKAGFVGLIVAIALRRGVRLGVLTALALAQTGEFSFVLAAEASSAGLLDANLRQVFVAGSIATLMLTPFLISWSPRIANALAQRADSRERAREKPQDRRRDHVVLAGFGITGQNLARVLRARDIPYVAVEGNAVAVRDALTRGEPILYGDATRRSLLEQAGVPEARLIAVAVRDPVATHEIVRAAREMSPRAPILVRAPYVRDVDALTTAGATKVVVEELEATLELVGNTLSRFGTPEESIARFTAELRDEGYVFMRTPETILDPWLSELLEGFTSHWVEVPASYEGESSLVELEVRARTGATVVAIESGGTMIPSPEPTAVVRAGDWLMAIGPADAIERLTALVGGDTPE